MSPAPAPTSRRPLCRLTLLLAGLLALAGCARSGAQTGTAQARFGLRAKPLAFQPPQVDHAELPNGITIDHYGDDAIPLVTVLVRVATGSVDDPAGKVGTAAMTAQVLRNGGSQRMNGDELDRQLESRGADLSVSSGREDTWLRLSVLKEDLAWGMQVLANLLAQPAFPQAKLDEARARQQVALQRRLDVPQDVALALYPMLVYGKDNPWAWSDTSRTLAALTIDDLRGHFKAFYQPRNLKVGFSGAVDWATAQDLARRSFGSLAASPASGAKPLPQAPPTTAAHVYIVPRDVTQDVIIFGQEGINRHSPDLFAVKVYNNVLSGGFTSRLIKEVRSDRGLAYEVYGRIGDGTQRGIYSNVALSKVPSAGEALKIMLEVCRDLIAHAAQPNEVDVARESDLNSFVFFFDTAEKIVRQRITLDAFGYPKDYLATYLDNLKAVTPEQVRQSAEKDIHPDRLIYLVVGKVDADLRKQLESLGPVTEISDEELRRDWL